MRLIENEKPAMEHIFFDEKGVSIDNTVEDEVRLGTRRDMQPGRAVYFDATNKITGTLPLFEGRKVLFTTWIKLLGGTSQVIFHMGSMRLIMLSSGQFRVYWESGSNYEVAAGVIPFNVWGHLGVVLTPSTCLVFWNGVEVLRRESASHLGIVSDTTDNSFALGYRYDATVEVSNFKGYLFDTRIHQGDATSIIIDTYNRKFTTTRAWYKLDDAAGIDVRDSSGNGRHGTWTGLVTSSHYTGSDVPFSWHNTVGYGIRSVSEPNGSLGNVGWTYSYNSSTKRITITSESDTAGYQGFCPAVSGTSIAFDRVVEIEYIHTRNGAISTTVSSSNGTVYSHVYDSAKGVIRAVYTGDTKFGWAGATSYQVGDYLEIVSLKCPQLIPRNEATPRLDVLGNRLTFEGLAPLKPVLKQSNCGNFNGTHLVNFGTQFTLDLHRFDVEFWLNSASTAGAGYIGYRCDQTGTIAGWCIKRINSIQAQFWYRVQSNTGNTSLTFNLPTGLSHIKVEKRTGSTTNTIVYVNGVLAAELNMNTGIYYESTRSSYLGAIQGGGGFNQYLTGEIWGVKITDYDTGTVVWESPVSEGVGSTVYNIAGSQHGTLTGDAAAFWSKRQNVLHHNLTKGFTLDIDNVKIPAKNRTQDALGNILTNPAGPWYNNAETQIDFSGGIASPYQATLLSSTSLATGWAGEDVVAGLMYRRRENKIDRIIVSNLLLAKHRRAIDDYAKSNKRSVFSPSVSVGARFGPMSHLRKKTYIISMKFSVTAAVDAHMSLIHVEGTGASDGIRIHTNSTGPISVKISSQEPLASGFTPAAGVTYHLVYFAKLHTDGTSYYEEIFFDGVSKAFRTGTGVMHDTSTYIPHTTLGGDIRSGNYTTISAAFKGTIWDVVMADYSDANLAKALAGQRMDNILFDVPCTEGRGTQLQDVVSGTIGVCNTNRTWNLIDK